MSSDVANGPVATPVAATGLSITCTRDAIGRTGSISPELSLADVAAASGHLSFLAEGGDRLRGCR